MRRFGPCSLLALSFASTSLAACTVGEDPDEDAIAGDGLAGDTDESSPDDEPGILAARVCAAGATVPGIDISYHQGTVNWTAVKNAGYGFAIVRLSDGASFSDPKFAENWAATKSVGLIRGAYQFFRPTQNVNTQADMMINAIGTRQPGDLPPVIDVEADGGLAPSAVAAKVRQWVDRVKAATGMDPIVYTGKYFWRDEVGGPASFANNPLWIAQYTTLCPDLPAPWGTWAFWQYSETGSVPGVSGNVDMNRFNGSLAELKAFAGGGGGGGGGGTGACQSATMGKDMPANSCVQAASDQKWYKCTGGAWVQQASTAGCASTFGWCSSATLGRSVPPRTCVQAASDSIWYQCDGISWATPVNASAQTGPAGACNGVYPL